MTKSMPRPEFVLPFVGAPSDERRNNWAPTLTGDTQKDYLLGLQYADDALELTQCAGREYFLDFVLMDMVRSFGFAHDEKNMEVAFLVRLARFAKIGAQFQKRCEKLPPGGKLVLFKPGDEDRQIVAGEEMVNGHDMEIEARNAETTPAAR